MTTKRNVDELAQVTRIGKPLKPTPYQRKASHVPPRPLPPRHDATRYNAHREQFKPRVEESTPFIERSIVAGAIIVIVGVVVVTLFPLIAETFPTLTSWVGR